MKKKVLVLSVGGSRIVPDKVDMKFLQELKKIILNISKKYKIVICTGGGSIARIYINALRRFNIGERVQNLVGIATTRLNASLVASILKVNEKIPRKIEEVKKILKKQDIVVCGGIKPGRTSDGVTAEIAAYLKADALINITNVKGLYDKDPRKFRNAKFIPKISHKDFAKMISKIKQKPGQHFVLDAVAADITRKKKIEVVIIKEIKQLQNYLSGKKLTGTVVS